MDISDRQFLYKIVRARDKRYDGRFYCGVQTTGIYCRPICPARPKIENITFFRSSTEAEIAGFRACLRCRPDLAPNSAQWNGTAAVVGRALVMIARGDADEISLEKFADKLGVSDRHLRRLFEEHLGASPIQVATSKRLHLARHLVTTSSLSVTEIAFASGYRSIRQFNEAFKEKFQSAPTQIKKAKDRDRSSHFIHVELPVIAPFDWNHIFGFLKNHGVYGVESFENEKYRRSFLIDKAEGALEIGYDSIKNQLCVALAVSDPADIRVAIEKVRDLFDTRLNPHGHLADLKSKDAIAGCYRKQLGLRIPGSWDSFETAICIILGQLVSVEQAKLKVKKLVEQFGTKISNPMLSACTHLFPHPRILKDASLKEIGITKVREQAIRELSRQVFDNEIDLSRSGDIEETREKLLAIRGIGPWTVEMIAMRCLGDTNAFPAKDLIIKRALKHHQNEKGDWSPWNAYITLALWKKFAKTLSKKEVHHYKVIRTPVGPITMIATAKALVAVLWENHSSIPEHAILSAETHPILKKTELQLKEYFKGLRSTFDIPLSPRGTEFQKRVWQELSKIPFGETITYGEQAKRIQKPKAVRAVGAANGKNPISIIVPCHRVLGASGSLTGFAGGLEVKKRLLALEGILVQK